jgi:Spy/CpxP family protein refolding chaperone
MQKQRTLLIIVLVVLVVNIATLAMLWMGKRENHDNPGPGQEPGIWLSEQLSLTPEQEDQYRDMRMQHHEAIMALEQRKKKLKDALFSQLKENTAPQLLDSISQQTAKLEAEKDMLTYNHFKRLRQILKPEQQQKFDAIIRQMLERMGGERPPGGDHSPEMRRPD